MKLMKRRPRLRRLIHFHGRRIFSAAKALIALHQNERKNNNPRFIILII